MTHDGAQRASEPMMRVGILQSRRRSPALVVGTLSGLCVFITIAVILAALVTGHPLDHASLLLIPGLPILAGSQLYAMYVLRRRSAGGERWRSARFSSEVPIWLMWKPLPVWTALVAAVLCVGDGLETVRASSALNSGLPSAPTARCAYPLVDHLVVTCVSAAKYRATSVADLGTEGGILLIFFTVQCLVAWSEYARLGDAESGSAR